jgi:type I restriction enzyme M protein
VGKGAIVVPTGFVTAKSGVEGKVLKKIIDDKIVYGCISMPSNVFANTGTNVSVLFFDKAKTHDNLILIDASKLGEDYQDSNGLKKKRLRPEEIDKIVDAFANQKAIEDFSVVVDYATAKEKYSLAAGQYFDVKIEYIELTQEEFEAKINGYKETLTKLFQEGDALNKEIQASLEKLKYEKD